MRARIGASGPCFRALATFIAIPSKDEPSDRRPGRARSALQNAPVMRAHAQQERRLVGEQSILNWVSTCILIRRILENLNKKFGGVSRQLWATSQEGGPVTILRWSSVPP